MSQERLKILHMLEEGQVTADEAAALLKATESNQAPQEDVDKLDQGFAWMDWLKTLVKWVNKEQVAESCDWTLERGELDTIVVRTVNGTVHYTGAEQATIAIQARKRIKAPTLASAEAFASQVQIRIEEQAGTLAIYPDHPKPPPQVEVQVDFVIHGPRAINLGAHSTNGHVQISGIEGVVQAASTNGAVQVQALSGAIQAKSTNGNVSIEAQSLTAASEFSTQNGAITIQVQTGQAPITAATVNGSVHVRLPDDYTSQVDIRTQNGQVHTDFPLLITHKMRNHLVGQIGAGGQSALKLRSQNGNVTLARAA